MDNNTGSGLNSGESTGSKCYLTLVNPRVRQIRRHQCQTPIPGVVQGVGDSGVFYYNSVFEPERF